MNEPFSFPDAIGPRADTDGFLFAGWDKALAAVRALASSRPDPTDLAVRVQPSSIAAALAYCRAARDARSPLPDAIYPFPDGAIVFEWDAPGEVLYQLEILGPGTGRLMINYPDGRPSNFEAIRWRATGHVAGIRSRHAAHTPPTAGERTGDGTDSFSLAA